MVSLNSMVLGLAALVATSVSAETRTLSSLPVHALPSFDYAALQQGDTPQRLLAAITTDGIVALKNVPNYANLRDNFLRRAAECALRGYEAPSEHTPRVSRKLFADGTKRYTISTNAGRELRAMHDESFAGCPGYASRYLALSQAVEHAVNTFGAALDLTSFRVSDGERPISSRQLVSEAVRLDHFHAYEAAPTGSSAVSDLTDGGDARDRRRLMDMSLPLHEDHGLFIAMSAPKWFEVDESSGSGRRLVERELASDASGLIIQTSSGQRVRPVLQSDELVIMMGTGASRWLRTSHAVPAVLHGMRMPEALVASSDAGRRSLRAWFGKMTLLPAYQRMLESGAPFERHLNATTRHLLTDDSYELKTVGCATGRHLAASEGSCTLRQCSTKAGVAAPEEPCSVICNRVGHSDSDASTCAEKCTCNNAPGTAEVCWMLCVANLPSDVCALDKQTCSGQKIVCSVPTSAPPAPTTPAPTKAPVPTTQAPTPTTQAPTPTTQAPAPTTPAPTTASPITPGPTTKSPSTPAPTTSSPTTPGPTTATPTPTEPQHC